MSNEYILERRMKKYRLRRKARRGEIMLRRIYKFCRFLFLLFIIFMLYRLAGSHYWYFPTDIYNSHDNRIEILGNSIVPNEKILNEIKKVDIPKEPIYKYNPAPIARQIEQLAPIKRAYIRRYWFPARFVIMIEEIIPVITVSPSEDAPDVAAFGLSGEYIGREYLPLNNKINTVKVLTYGTNGDDYEKWDTDKINDIYKLAKSIEEYSGEKLQYLDLRTKNDAYAQLDTVKLRLGKIDVSLFDRIKGVKEILSSPDIIRLKNHTKYIDLSWQKVKYVNLDED